MDSTSAARQTKALKVSRHPPVQAHAFDLLGLITVIAVIAAALLTLFGTTQRVYGGYWWWVAAQWLLCLGLFLQSFEPLWPLISPFAHSLEMQWPVVVLAGMRRFYARREWRVPAYADVCLLVACFAGWMVTWGLERTPISDVLAFSAAGGTLHAYAAINALMLPEVRRSSALKVFIFMSASVAVTHALRAVLSVSLPGSQAAAGLVQGLLTGTSALTLVYLGLLLTFERTDRNVRINHRRLKFLADTDILTGVPNRRHFHERAELALSASGVARNALLMFDIDHFKQVNDRLGHAAGDEALRQVALCTRQTLRSIDVAGRLGGDEFGVLLPATHIDEAMAVAARIVERLEQRQIAPQVARLSLSFGVVQLAATETITDGLRRADQALYEAKRQGRGRAVAAIDDSRGGAFRGDLPFR